MRSNRNRSKMRMNHKTMKTSFWVLIAVGIICLLFQLKYQHDTTTSHLVIPIPKLQSTSLDIEQQFLKLYNESYPQLMPSNKFLPQITEFQLRRTRDNLGDLRRFHHLLHKLDAHQCLEILVLGTSVSWGTGVNRSTELFHMPLTEFLNGGYPCDHPEGHRVTNKAKPGSHVDYVIANFGSMIISDPTAYDLIICEYAVSQDLQNFDAAKRSAHKMEIILRGLLQLPYDPMVLYLGIGWAYGGRGWAHTPPYYRGSFEGHKRMTTYYQIPTISTFNSLWPIQMYDRIMPLLGTRNLTVWDKGDRAWFADWCCHANADQHKWAAMGVAYAIYIEFFKMNSHPDEVSRFEFDAKGHLPPAWMMTSEDQERWESRIHPLSDYVFDEPNWEPQSDENIMIGGDWSLKADGDPSKPQRQKWGLIATQKHSELAIKVNVTRLINIAYLETYENIGSVVVWFDEKGKIEYGGGRGGGGGCRTRL